jgi:predicted phage terminase large subunit-like protein
MSAVDDRMLTTLMRTDLSSFIQKSFQIVSPGDRYRHNWHVDAIAYQLERCLRGEINRLIITLPPRNLKSIAVSVAFPAFILGQRPKAEIIGVSYAQDLSQKHARDTRAVMQSKFYRRAFPLTRLDPKKSAEAEFMTTRKGVRLATSIGGTLTGRGGDFIIIDDAHKPDESLSDVKRQSVIEWYRSTLTSRLNDKDEGVIIVVQQRVYEEDLAGYLLEQGGWTHLNLPAIAEEGQTIQLGPKLGRIRTEGSALHPERESLEILAQLKSDMGSYAFAAQYQQQPAPAGGGLIKKAWFGEYDVAPTKTSGDLVIQSWDTASKSGELNDYSVCTTWLKRDGRLYLLSVLRRRFEFPDLLRAVKSMYWNWNADELIIEDKGSGTSLIQQLRKDQIYPRAENPELDKIYRMVGETAIMEAGGVFLPKHAAWKDDYLGELCRFPNGRHDDQVDSTSQALSYVRKRRVSDPSIRRLC